MWFYPYEEGHIKAMRQLEEEDHEWYAYQKGEHIMYLQYKSGKAPACTSSGYKLIGTVPRAALRIPLDRGAARAYIEGEEG